MDKERRKVKEVEVKQRADDILATLDERQRRLWAGAEARQIGRGGISLVAKMTGMDKRTVSKGVRELQNGEKPGEGRQRKPGGGRKKIDGKPTRFGKSVTGNRRTHLAWQSRRSHTMDHSQ